MSTPFLSEIRIMSFNYAPKGWAMCNGQLLPINQNQALFSLLGTTYGGDGRVNFALPNLQGAAPLNSGQGVGLSDRFLGESGGSQTVTLLETEIPTHAHSARAFSTSKADQTSPAGHVWSKAQSGRQPLPMYSATAGAPMYAQALTIAGGSAPHNNLMPYLTLTFIIALQGVYPPRS